MRPFWVGRRFIVIFDQDNFKRLNEPHQIVHLEGAATQVDAANGTLPNNIRQKCIRSGPTNYNFTIRIPRSA